MGDPSTSPWKQAHTRTRKIDRTLPSLFRKFHEISGLQSVNKKTSLTNETLWAFLAKRYPRQICKHLERVVAFTRFGDFTDYIKILEKLMNMSRKQVNNMVFECYDYNEDNFICFQDAFQVMSDR
jgi:hypothetical protein